MKIRIEFRPQDVVLGWRVERRYGQLHVWLYLVPMLPLHLTFGEAMRLPSAAERYASSKVRPIFSARGSLRGIRGDLQ